MYPPQILPNGLMPTFRHPGQSLSHALKHTSKQNHAPLTLLASPTLMLKDEEH